MVTGLQPALTFPATPTTPSPDTAHRKQTISLMDVKRVSSSVLCRTWLFSLEWKLAGDHGEIGRINEVGGSWVESLHPTHLSCPAPMRRLLLKFSSWSSAPVSTTAGGILASAEAVFLCPGTEDLQPDIWKDLREQPIPWAAWSWGLWPPLEPTATETLPSRWAELASVFKTK